MQKVVGKENSTCGLGLGSETKDLGDELILCLNVEFFCSRPGYSFVGEVIGLGDGVDALQIGDRVICSAHHESHAVMNAKSCLKVPDNVTNEDASFFNLLAKPSLK